MTRDAGCGMRDAKSPTHPVSRISHPGFSAMLSL
jgi:hypothetical protein